MTYYESTQGNSDNGWFWLNESFPSEIERLCQNIWQTKDLIQRSISRFPNNCLWTSIDESKWIHPFGCILLHLCGTEHHWIEHYVGQSPLARNKSDEFVVHSVLSLKDLSSKVDEVTSKSKKVLINLSENDFAKIDYVGKFSLEFILHYFMQYSAFHAGQLALICKYFNHEFEMYQ